MQPLRLKMIRPMPLQRLAPRTQAASGAAVAGLSQFYWGAPDQRSPEQLRTSLHQRLIERYLAWSSCPQVAWGLQFFYTTTPARPDG